MKYTVLLYGDNTPPPSWWMNFIQHTILDVKSYLQVGSHRHSDEYGNEYLDFDSEQDYMMFVLRWS